MGLIGRITVLALVVLALTPIGRASGERNDDKTPSSSAQRGPPYLGKPLSDWVKAIRDRDRKQMDLAFDAIRELGPDAAEAVPELTRIVAEPFSPVRIGADPTSLIMAKLYDIDLRADAIDALGAIGEDAASSAPPLVQWALAVRVIPDDVNRTESNQLFVDLVAIDVLHRMRVAGAIAQFGRKAFPFVVTLLVSPNDEERKLAVAILSEKVLPIAARLLNSRDCEERALGIAILRDMWPVVAKEHLAELKRVMVCDTD